VQGHGLTRHVHEARYSPFRLQLSATAYLPQLGPPKERATNEKESESFS
jgi:hypothetical protein